MKKYRLIIAGTRTFNDYNMLKEELYNTLRSVNADEVEIVSGSCYSGTHTFTRPDGTKVYGADGIGERFAEDKGFPVKLFPADWDKHGKKAGPIRNEEMAKYATNCIVFWDGQSKGTKSMIDMAKKYISSGSVIKYKEKQTLNP